MTAQQEVSAATSAIAGGGGGGVNIAEIFGAIDGAIDGWYAREAEKQQALGESPCMLEAALLQIALAAEGTANASRGLALVMSSAIADAIDSAISRSGRPGPRFQGGPGQFYQYLVASGVLNLAPLVGAIAATPLCVLSQAPHVCGAAIVDSWLAGWRPAEGEPPGKNPTGSNPSGSSIDPFLTPLPKGFKLASGVYVYQGGGPARGRTGIQHLEHGKLRGDAVRAAWWEWRSQVLREVNPPGIPASRARLAELAGDSGDAIPWVDGNPVSENSLIARQEAIVQWLGSRIAIAGFSCEVAREREQDILLQPEEEQTKRTFALAAVVGAIGLAWALGRK